MPGGKRNTPITDFFYRMAVDAGFVEKFLANPRETLEEFLTEDPDTINALLDAFESRNFSGLQELADSEHPDRLLIIPWGWVH